MEATAVNNQLTIIDKSIEIFKNGSAILRKNQERTSKALTIGNSILSAITAAGGKIPDSELDERCMKYLTNCNTATKEMKESRMQVTQLMDLIKKMYTEEENKLDASKAESVPAKIQQFRNNYAKAMAIEEEKRRKEAEAKAAKGKERVEIEAYINNEVTKCLLDFLAKKKLSTTNSFNLITLETFEQKSGALKLMSVSFPQDKLPEILQVGERPYWFSKHTEEEYTLLKKEIVGQYDFPAFAKSYETQMQEFKLSLIDKLPSKKAELLEAERIRQEQIAAAERARQEEVERQKAIEKASAAQKQKLEEEARIARERDAEKARQAEAELKRLEEERATREKAEREKQLQEAEEQRKKAEELSEMSKAAGTAQVLFDQVAETAVVTPAPEVRSGFEITVHHPAGWVEIFQFWFQREGCKMAPEEMGKKSLNQMKSYAEGEAKKNDVKIESKFLKYDTAIKSVNRKVVATK